MSSIQLPSLEPAEVKRRLRESAPTFLVYNPAPEWFAPQYNGSFFYFPPSLGDDIFVDHPTIRDDNGKVLKVRADGILKIKDRYGVIYGKEAKPCYHPVYGYSIGWARPIADAQGKIEEETADRVVQFLTTKYGAQALDPSMRLGLTLLSGDPEVDKPIKLAARALWAEAHRAWAEGVRQGRLQFLEKWRHDNPGRTDFPPMSARERKAEEILLQVEEAKVASSLHFICSHGDFETDNEGLYKKHIKVRHPSEEDKKEVAPLVKRGPGRPRKYPLPTKEELFEDSLSEVVSEN